ILGVGEVEPRAAVDDAGAHRRDGTRERQPGDRPGRTQPLEREHERHEPAGDRRGPRAPVRLEHVAIDEDRALAERHPIGHRAQTAPDEALYLVRPPAWAPPLPLDPFTRA